MGQHHSDLVTGTGKQLPERLYGSGRKILRGLDDQHPPSTEQGRAE